MKTVIFARVSTAIQDYDRQVNDLTALADRNGWSIEAIFAEKISGAKKNPMSQFLITLLAEVARMERSTIKERMVSGYDNFRANGGKVGRKVGYHKSDEAMKSEYAEELRLLSKGISLRNVSKLTNTSVNTLRKVKVLI